MSAVHFFTRLTDMVTRHIMVGITTDKIAKNDVKTAKERLFRLTVSFSIRSRGLRQAVPVLRLSLAHLRDTFCERPLGKYIPSSPIVIPDKAAFITDFSPSYFLPSNGLASHWLRKFFKKNIKSLADKSGNRNLTIPINELSHTSYLGFICISKQSTVRCIC